MNIEECKKVTVIGAGSMGHGIAQVALMAGFHVNLCDIKQEYLDAAETKMFASLDKLASKELLNTTLVNDIKTNKLSKYLEIAEAVKEADFIIEVTPEIQSIKTAALVEIDQNAPKHAIIATNTSTMDINMLAESIERKDKFFGMHYFNPPVLMKLVEVVKGNHTSAETAQFARDYVKKAGKELIFAEKCTPGFIANRIGAPMDVYRCLLLDVDKVDPVDFDITMRNTGMKMGLYMLADFVGLDIQRDCMAHYEVVFGSDYQQCKTILKLISENKLGKKTGEGFYIWPEKGLPEMDLSRFTNTLDPDIPYFIQANEATKLVEDGICTFEDCDKAIRFGFNAPGPIEYIQKFSPEVIADKLNYIADKYNKKIFKPTETIKRGGYLLEGQ
ncbi:MAG: hypothetical protein IKK29_04085 [Christensenellaceae bacterium]|nr:hypothetical protein [Christensenellaceae bacterium]